LFYITLEVIWEVVKIQIIQFRYYTSINYKQYIRQEYRYLVQSKYAVSFFEENSKMRSLLLTRWNYHLSLQFSGCLHIVFRINQHRLRLCWRAADVLLTRRRRWRKPCRRRWTNRKVSKVFFLMVR